MKESQMQVIHSSQVRAGRPQAGVIAALNSVSEDHLREDVEALSFPRHFEAEPEANRRAADWIAGRLRDCGYEAFMQGCYANVVALPRGAAGRPLTLIG